MTGRADLRLGISDVAPVVSCGAFSARAVVGEHVPITATVFREGHDAVAANVVWTPPEDTGDRPLVRMSRFGEEPDRWLATVVPDRQGLWTFRVEAWSDPLATWHHTVEVKVEAGQGAEDLANDLEEGARLLDRVAEDADDEHRESLKAAAAALRDSSLDLTARIAPAFSASLQRYLHEHPVRELVTATPDHEVWVDRAEALYGSWYEFFPRSEGPVVGGKAAHGTFANAQDRLPAIAEMGFDVVYLPPIHPIGTTARKGRNNLLDAGPSDPGSPWAIGSADGGHTAIAPELGTLDDFRRFRSEVVDLGMEVALDYALQCSPDHPWVHEHPEWFWRRPDGSIRYAENPPKKYQDIYPINFWPDREADRLALWSACREVLRYWIGEGVRIFRVDNPHTKPLAFWAWLIERIHRDHPDVLFLSEAFTRPKVMARLAEVGFTQSYTYFTWRSSAWELREYVNELAYGPAADYMRPNFWPNTPDILAGPLRNGPPAAFLVRYVLAATLVPSYGIYSGFELFENQPASDANEEYLNSEKYEIRTRDWAAADSMVPTITRVNEIRRRHRAFQSLRNVSFHGTGGNEAFLAWSKGRADDGDLVLVVVNLDPHHAQETVLDLDLGAMGLPWHGPFSARDELGGESYSWDGAHPFIRLDPSRGQVAHILALSA